MVNKIKTLIKKYWYIISVLAITCILIVLASKCDNNITKRDKILTNVEYTDSNGTYHKIYQDKKFKDLKKENKTLYDSLKAYKEQISYLTQFKYQKTYNTGKVTNKPVREDVERVVNKKDTIKVYEYKSQDNDSLSYTLKIGSVSRPEWYELKTTIKEKITLVNKTASDGTNHLTIDTSNKGNITDVTTYKKKEKKSFWKRFKAGPSVSVGYDPIHKNIGMTIGVGVMFDLTK